MMAKGAAAHALWFVGVTSQMLTASSSSVMPSLQDTWVLTIGPDPQAGLAAGQAAWRELAVRDRELPPARQACAAVHVDGCLFIAGGSPGFGPADGEALIACMHNQQA